MITQKKEPDRMSLLSGPYEVLSLFCCLAYLTDIHVPPAGTPVFLTIALVLHRIIIPGIDLHIFPLFYAVQSLQHVRNGICCAFGLTEDFVADAPDFPFRIIPEVPSDLIEDVSCFFLFLRLFLSDVVSQQEALQDTAAFCTVCHPL